jgi:hypothetical protein
MQLRAIMAYSMACCEWKVPFLPVKPWHKTRVFLSTWGRGGRAVENARAMFRVSAMRWDMAVQRTCVAVRDNEGLFRRGPVLAGVADVGVDALRSRGAQECGGGGGRVGGAGAGHDAVAA